MVEPIKDPKVLVNELGGVSRAAEILGERYPSTVSNWVRLGRFPAGKYMHHAAELEARGISASPEIWFGCAQEAAE